MLKAQTVAWNRDRELLENFDPSLELKMLSEEAREFYQAETLAHMLAEYADFQFVLDGTKAKFGSQPLESYLGLGLFIQTYKDMMSWSAMVQSDMRSCITSMLQPRPSEAGRLIVMASEIVIRCNNLKGKKKNSDGKVVKNEHHLDPKDMIQDELDRLGF